MTGRTKPFLPNPEKKATSNFLWAIGFLNRNHIDEYLWNNLKLHVYNMQLDKLPNIFHDFLTLILQKTG